MANAKHVITNITYTLDPAPIGRASLGVVLVLLEDTDLGSDPELAGTSAVTATYSSKAAISSAVTNSHFTSAQGDLLKAVFDQIPAPQYVRAGDVDVVGTDGYDDGYNAVAAETDDFFYVTQESRATVDIEALAGALSADPVLFVAQTADTTALNASPGALDTAFATTTGQENMVFVFHHADTAALAEAYAAARGTFDPDEKSAGWQGVVRGIAAYDDGTVSAAQREHAYANHLNLMLSAGTQGGYVSKGRTRTGRQVKEMVSVFWYITRLAEDILDTKLDYDARGALIPVNEDGQAVLGGIIEARYRLGVAAGHFLAEERGGLVLEFPETISSADLGSGTIRTSEHRITVVPNGEQFTIGVDFTKDVVNVSLEEAE